MTFNQIINKKNNKNLNFSNKESDIKNSDIFIVTVPTPVDSKNQPDLKHLAEASKIVGLLKKTKCKIIWVNARISKKSATFWERNSKLKDHTIENIDYIQKELM